MLDLYSFLSFSKCQKTSFDPFVKIPDEWRDYSPGEKSPKGTEEAGCKLVNLGITFSKRALGLNYDSGNLGFGETLINMTGKKKSFFGVILKIPNEIEHLLICLLAICVFLS